MRKLIPLLLLPLLASLNASSQSLLINSLTTDTTICFTIPQSKFLLKQHYGREECVRLLGICEETNLAYRSWLTTQDSIRNVMIESYQTLHKENEANKVVIKDLKVDLQKQRTETEIQKKMKGYFALGGGLVGFLLMGIITAR